MNDTGDHLKNDHDEGDGKAAQQETRSAREARLNTLFGLRASDKPDKPEGETAQAAEKAQAGIAPMDLLTLPAEQSKLINWLSRKKQATFDELVAAMQQPPAQIEELLTALEEAGYVNTALVGGEIAYRVVFRGAARRSGVGLPREILERLELDPLAFLRQVSLFRGLSDDELRAVAGKMEERRYQREDVLLWQGQASDHVYFIKSGIVGISRYTPQSKEQKVLNYLKQGEVLGEYSVIAGPGSTASATASAMSNVVALTLKRDDFVSLLNKHASVALELARILAARLIATGTRASGGKGARVVMVVGARLGVGATALGSTMALTLAAGTKQTVVYTEMPESRRLVEIFEMPSDAQTFKHPGGYDVVVWQGSTMLPPPVRATLLLDQLFARYQNIVIGVPGHASEIINYLCGYADQIILVTTPEPDAWARLTELSGTLRAQINPEKVGLFTVINRVRPEQIDLSAPGRVDFDLPFNAPVHPPHLASLAQVAEPVARLTSTLADRLGRTNAVSLYIPTTTDVNTKVDTSAYVERTLAFLGGLFGGATASQAQGVWNSAEAGLVSEDIFIVRSYVTQADLDNHLQTVLDYVEQMKQELKQEAMAVEINQKLMLI